MHGFGVYQFGNGHRYEGAWHEGRRQGLGMYTFEVVRRRVVSGKMGFLMFQAHETRILDLLPPVNHFKVLNVRVT
ncbi:hypothetical protein Patl1_14599 [Pistacia atlantica]|uniref:Uncharacterized protein n=1 Tax=Pistacia atlantica TaxID=434234 RepID=A0ACC1AT36_9ROSI|nr:hypothetical protein Patl1_14599 [Pistacia atlantica]